MNQFGTVKHPKFGEGTICAVEAKYISVSFNGIQKKFIAEQFSQYCSTDRETTAALDRELQMARTAAEQKRQAELAEAERLQRKEEQRNTEAERPSRSMLLKTLKSFGFEGFLHTTEFENFRKIVKNGYLYSREELKRKGISFRDKANSEIIGGTNYAVKNHVRFYYRFGTPTNFAASYDRPVTLVFDEALIYEPHAKFSLGNARSASSPIVESADEARKFDWECCFEKGPPSKSKYIARYDSTDSFDMVVRKRNAEFLYPREVPIKRIVKVYFPRETDKKEAETFCNEPLRSVLVCDPSKFDFYRRS